MITKLKLEGHKVDVENCEEENLGDEHYHSSPITSSNKSVTCNHGLESFFSGITFCNKCVTCNHGFMKTDAVFRYFFII